MAIRSDCLLFQNPQGDEDTVAARSDCCPIGLSLDPGTKCSGSSDRVAAQSDCCLIGLPLDQCFQVSKDSKCLKSFKVSRLKGQVSLDRVAVQSDGCPIGRPLFLFIIL
ncbi:hypothetical protein Hanom_Chr12g01139611 [Helianthus anomalus]